MRWPFRKDPDAADQAEVDRIVETWTRTCEAIGLTDDRDTVTGITHVVPRIDHVTLGPPTVLSVRLCHGMLPEDITGQARRLARSMGAQSLRVEPRGYTHALVTLLPDDPLSEAYSLPRGPLSGPVLVARDEQGGDIAVAPADLGHVAVQGATGSGKSAFLYSLLSQLADRDGVEVTGVDPSGILLRPFVGPTEHRNVALSGLIDRHDVGLSPLLGLSDPAAVEAHVSRLVADMDRRISAIPSDRDTLPASEGLRFVVLEEYPGLLRYLDAADPKIGKRVRALVARLLAEGRKAGLRVILVAQRAEASVIGGTERGQCSTRISFRVDNVDAVRLLHPDADPETAAAHASAVPGVALLSVPGRPLTRVRGPWIGSYAEYVARVAA